MKLTGSLNVPGSVSCSGSGGGPSSYSVGGSYNPSTGAASITFFNTNPSTFDFTIRCTAEGISPVIQSVSFPNPFNTGSQSIKVNLRTGGSTSVNVGGVVWSVNISGGQGQPGGQGQLVEDSTPKPDYPEATSNIEVFESPLQPGDSLTMCEKKDKSTNLPGSGSLFHEGTQIYSFNAYESSNGEWCHSIEVGSLWPLGTYEILVIDGQTISSLTFTVEASEITEPEPEPEPTFDEDFAKCLDHYEKQNLALARNCLLKMVDNYQPDPYVFGTLAATYSNADSLDELKTALSYLEKALELDPNDKNLQSAVEKLRNKIATLERFPEPPPPLIFSPIPESKPFLDSLFDAEKCTGLEAKLQLFTNFEEFPPCHNWSVFLDSGHLLKFNLAEDWKVKLSADALDYSVTALLFEVPAAKTFLTSLGMLDSITKYSAITGEISDVNFLSLLLSKGEGTFVTRAVEFSIKCPTGECDFFLFEENGDSYQIWSPPSVWDSITKEMFVKLPHNSVYIFVTYASEDEIPDEEEPGGGCLIATATFGSELAPQVQQLRELRDNTLLATSSGTSFMTGFNALYYSFSPAIADLERQSPIFKEVVKVAITPLITSLSLLNYVEIDSDQDVLGYGIGIILLNIGMYFVAPAIIILTIKRRMS